MLELSRRHGAVTSTYSFLFAFTVFFATHMIFFALTFLPGNPSTNTSDVGNEDPRPPKPRRKPYPAPAVTAHDLQSDEECYQPKSGNLGEKQGRQDIHTEISSDTYHSILTIQTTRPTTCKATKAMLSALHLYHSIPANKRREPATYRATTKAIPSTCCNCP